MRKGLNILQYENQTRLIDMPQIVCHIPQLISTENSWNLPRVFSKKFARSVHKDRGLNVLHYEKQTRLMDSLSYATATSTENLLKIFGIYREFSVKVFFSSLNKKTFINDF